MSKNARQRIVKIKGDRAGQLQRTLQFVIRWRMIRFDRVRRARGRVVRSWLGRR